MDEEKEALNKGKINNVHFSSPYQRELNKEKAESML